MSLPKLYGVIGWPIKHSLSPAMHNAAFKKLGIDAKYTTFEVPPEKLEDFILNRKDVEGFNITIPHKIKAREILQRKNYRVVKTGNYANEYIYYDNISGAINTVDNRNMEYCNTDPIGFRHSLESDLKFKTKDKNALLIGCGGAGRAVVADLSYYAHWIKKIYVYDINKEAVDSAKKYYSNFERKIEFIYDEVRILELKDEFDLLVNASSVGMEEGDDRLAVPREVLLNKKLYVFDLVYNRQTRLFKEASTLGLPVVNGKGMLAAQGAFSFSLWTGILPIVDIVGIMREALNNALDKK